MKGEFNGICRHGLRVTIAIPAEVHVKTKTEVKVKRNPVEQNGSELQEKAVK